MVEEGKKYGGTLQFLRFLIQRLIELLDVFLRTVAPMQQTVADIADRGQRRAQLMRNMRHEIRFHRGDFRLAALGKDQKRDARHD